MSENKKPKKHDFSSFAIALKDVAARDNETFKDFMDIFSFTDATFSDDERIAQFITKLDDPKFQHGLKWGIAQIDKLEKSGGENN